MWSEILQKLATEIGLEPELLTLQASQDFFRIPRMRRLQDLFHFAKGVLPGGASRDLTSFPDTCSWWISGRVLRKWHLQLHPILGELLISRWVERLTNNSMEALGAALPSPGIAGIKRPAVGSDSCWNCCPSLHLDLPIRGPQKILTCSL